MHRSTAFPCEAPLLIRSGSHRSVTKAAPRSRGTLLLHRVRTSHPFQDRDPRLERDSFGSLRCRPRPGGRPGQRARPSGLHINEVALGPLDEVALSVVLGEVVVARLVVPLDSVRAPSGSSSRPWRFTGQIVPHRALLVLSGSRGLASTSAPSVRPNRKGEGVQSESREQRANADGESSGPDSNNEGDYSR
jgi:hypothetical protein